MLANGLGELLVAESAISSRFVDLFAGTGSVAIHVAKNTRVEVLAIDLQSYSQVLTNAVVSRVTEFAWQRTWINWRKRAESYVGKIVVSPTTRGLTRGDVARARKWCAQQSHVPITLAYGGHYFSPSQSIWIDALRVTLPKREPAKTVALAALIQAASKVAAAPGHTAQPFQPTPTALPFIECAWMKDVCEQVAKSLAQLAMVHAKVVGQAKVGDANSAAQNLRRGDLVFIDPPYSGVHYSRFYHVLESIADGHCGTVNGAGRYPPTERRPWSRYSVISESQNALEDLLRIISDRGATAIVTFPNHECSNGLSGKLIRNVAKKYFSVTSKTVKSRFSTLGGGRGDAVGVTRKARQSAEELILIMRPKGASPGQ